MRFVYHNGIACHTDQKQPVEGKTEYTFCPTCNDWFKPIRISSVATLDSRVELEFVSNSQDVESIKAVFGREWDGESYDSFFVRVSDGEYREIWGMAGVVPYKSKMVTQVL